MAKKITSLTPEQTQLFDEFVKKWVTIGLSTEPTNKTLAETAICLCYETANLAKPKNIFWSDSPFAQIILYSVLNDKQLTNKLEKYDISENIRALVCLDSSLSFHVDDNAQKLLKDAIQKKKFKESMKTAVNNSIYSQYDTHWLSFYDFFGRICDEFKTEISKLSGIMKITEQASCWMPYEHACFVSQKPYEISLNLNGQLHKDGDLALKYLDGWGIYSLNGIRVPQWLVMTSSEKLDCKKILAEDNVEIRREGIRKIGVERFVYKLGATSLDKKDEYELLAINIGLDEQSKALKMLNPSVPELWHIEFVPNNIETVEQALNFRNGLSVINIDDEYGEEWFQQGDVIIRPKGATKLKSRPSKLT